MRRGARQRGRPTMLRRAATGSNLRLRGASAPPPLPLLPSAPALLPFSSHPLGARTGIMGTGGKSFNGVFPESPVRLYDPGNLSLGVCEESADHLP